MVKEIELSVVIPVYNGGDNLYSNIKEISNYLLKLTKNLEIIIVDDGSTDGCVEECKRITGVYIISHGKNRGKGSALKAGIMNSHGHFVIYTDADIPYELDDISIILYYLKSGFHVVIGDRTLPGSVYYPLKRRFMSRVFSKFVAMFVTGGLGDTQCGLKGFHGDICRRLFSLSRIDHFAIDVEILYIALKHCLDIKSIPVHLKNNALSSVNIIKDPLHMLWDILKIKYNYKCELYKDKALIKYGLPHL